MDLVKTFGTWLIWLFSGFISAYITLPIMVYMFEVQLVVLKIGTIGVAGATVAKVGAGTMYLYLIAGILGLVGLLVAIAAVAVVCFLSYCAIAGSYEHFKK